MKGNFDRFQTREMTVRKLLYKIQRLKEENEDLISENENLQERNDSLQERNNSLCQIIVANNETLG